MLEFAMSIQDNWLANLKALVDELAPGPNSRGVKRAAFRAIAAAASLNEEYVYQLYNEKGGKSIGIDMAKAIARAYAQGRDHSWFDLPPAQGRQMASGPSPAVPEDSMRAAMSAELLTVFELLPADDRAALLREARERAARILGRQMLAEKYGVSYLPSDELAPRRDRRATDVQQIQNPFSSDDTKKDKVRDKK
jgi:hypothetical protein